MLSKADSSANRLIDESHVLQSVAAVTILAHLLDSEVTGWQEGIKTLLCSTKEYQTGAICRKKEEEN